MHSTPRAALLPLAPLALALTAPAQDFGPGRDLVQPASYVTEVFSGDIDGDGDIDLAYGGFDRVTWYENRGPLGFRLGAVVQENAAVSSSSYVSAIEGADVDQDGDLDLVTVKGPMQPLLLWENQGGGHFAAPQTLNVNVHNVYDVHFADFDGDGLDDMLLASAGGGGVSWHRSLGGGAFAPEQMISTKGGAYYALDAGDLDGDGDLDIVAGSHQDAVLILNLGGGAFAPTVVLDNDPQSCRDITLAHVDGDGQLDVVFPSTFGEYLAWHRNLGGGAFGAKQIIDTNLSTAEKVDAADLDGDGDDDLIVGTYDTYARGEVTLFRNDGTGVFGRELVATGIEVVEGLHLADIDRNGTLDPVFGTRDLARLSFLPNLGAATFGAEVVAIDGVEQPGEAVPADIDGDGDLDVIVHRVASAPLAFGVGGGDLVVFENLGFAGFGAPASLLSAAGAVLDFAVLDVENDGDIDVVVAGAFGLELHTNLGNGTFGPGVSITGPTSSGWRVAAGDLDGDGLADLAYGYGDAQGYSGAGSVGILQNLGGGQFSGTFFLTSSIGVGELKIMDVVGNASPEVVFVQGYYDIVTWIQLFGSGQFGAVGQAPGFQSGNSSVELGDIDGDGLEDLLVSGWYELAYYPNLGNDTYGTRVTIVGQPGSDVRMADLDGDGLEDLLMGLTVQYNAPGGLVWRKNLGGGSFGPDQAIEPNFINPNNALAVDLDGDGGLDVLGTNYGGHELSWFPNLMTADCDGNGTFDAVDIANGVVQDCDGNGVPDSCDLLVPGADLDGDGQLDVCVPPALLPSATTFSLAGGGAQKLELQGPGGAGLYIVVGSLSGTTPGTPFGSVTVPLVADTYSTKTVQQANQPPYTNTLGNLDPSGRATAVITVPAGFNPALAGVTAHHAFLVIQPGGGASFASNPVPLILVP